MFLSCALLQLYSDRTCIVIGLYCLKQHYGWPVEMLKVKGEIRGLGKCLTQENKDGCHRNVNAS